MLRLDLVYWVGGFLWIWLTRVGCEAVLFWVAFPTFIFGVGFAVFSGKRMTWRVSCFSSAVGRSACSVRLSYCGFLLQGFWTAQYRTISTEQTWDALSCWNLFLSWGFRLSFLKKSFRPWVGHFLMRVLLWSLRRRTWFVWVPPWDRWCVGFLVGLSFIESPWARLWSYRKSSCSPVECCLKFGCFTSCCSQPQLWSCSRLKFSGSCCCSSVGLSASD